MIDLNVLLEATNQGRDIICNYLPEAAAGFTRKNHKFKIRPEEKTASASLYKTPEGIWKINDFGDKTYSAIDLVMHLTGLSFTDAINDVCHKLGISAEGKVSHPVIRKPDFSKKKAPAGSKEGSYSFIEQDYTEAALKKLGEYVTEPICKRYNLVSIKSYTYIKNGEALTFTANDNYFIYLFKHGSFSKLYRPDEQDKAYRFIWIGKKPDDFIFGLRQVHEQIKMLEKQKLQDDDDKQEAIKVPEIIISSGESDSLNVAAAGFLPVCFNSETAHITWTHIRTLESLAKQLYNLPDIDDTGLKQSRIMSLKFLQIKTIKLPDSLKIHKDWRGNPCKDAKDYFRYYSISNFKSLVFGAVSFKFWNEYYVHPKKGSPYIDYQFKNAACYEFLNANGFYRIEDLNEKTGFSFVHIENNIISQIKPNEIKAFIHKYMEDNYFPEGLRDFLYKSAQLSESSLSNLKPITPEFVYSAKDYQKLFFQNTALYITADNIKPEPYTPSSGYVWEKKVIKHKFQRTDETFSVQKSGNEYSINWNEKFKNFDFIKFLYNTGNTYWRNPNWSKDEKILTEVDLHFLSKATAIGYLMHRHKIKAKAYAIYAMDMRESSIDESNGGTGKSILGESIRSMLLSFPINGRNIKATEDNHIFSGVNKWTEMVHIEDAGLKFNINYFLNPITSFMYVNPKHSNGYILTFDESPKFYIDTNYSPALDQTTRRRIHLIGFADYYHRSDGKYYKETFTPFEEFGRTMFQEWPESDYNTYYNFIADCIRCYLQYGLIEAPEEMMIRKTIRQKVGEDFMDWAETYIVEGKRLNDAFVREDAYKNFLDRTMKNQRDMTATRFRKCVEKWSDYKGFVFNPENLCNDGELRRIFKYYDDIKKEVFYISSNTCKGDSPADLLQNAGENNKDIPF